jgi:hypothetical protein
LAVNEKSKKEKLGIEKEALTSTKNELKQLYSSIPAYYSDYAKK